MRFSLFLVVNQCNATASNASYSKASLLFPPYMGYEVLFVYLFCFVFSDRSPFHSFLREKAHFFVVVIFRN